MDVKQINRWLEENYPSLRVRQDARFRWALWQKETQVVVGRVASGEEFFYTENAWSVVFPIDNRIPGEWILDEVLKRDPRLWHNEGNMFHDAFLLSQAAEADREKRAKHAQESGMRMWEACKQNKNLMNRVAKKMERGDMVGAYQEFSLESLFMNAYIENPKETRALLAANAKHKGNIGF